MLEARPWTRAQRRPRLAGFAWSPLRASLPVPSARTRGVATCALREAPPGDGRRDSADDLGTPATRREPRRVVGNPNSRSERMKARWRDPEWRAAMLAARNTPEAQQRRSEKAKRLWADPDYRARMQRSRRGRKAWNAGVPASSVTRLRMSMSRKGVKKSEETKRRMSESKLMKSDATWKARISEAKRGKSRFILGLRREYKALRGDLRLWSDSYRATHGRLPRESNFENAVAAPMLALKIRRYISLSHRLSCADKATAQGHEILHFDTEDV